MVLYEQKYVESNMAFLVDYMHDQEATQFDEVNMLQSFDNEDTNSFAQENQLPSLNTSNSV